jgi:hypothetical protein
VLRASGADAHGFLRKKMEKMMMTMMTIAREDVLRIGEGGNRVQSRRYGVNFEQTA